MSIERTAEATALLNVLKDTWPTSKIQDYVKRETSLYYKFAKKVKAKEGPGKAMLLPVHTVGDQSVSGQAYKNAMTDGNDLEYQSFEIAPTLVVGRIQLWDIEAELADGKGGALIDLADKKMQSVMDGMASYIDTASAISAGDNCLGTVKSNTSGGATVVYVKWQKDDGATYCNEPGCQYLEPGMRVVFYDENAGAVVDSVSHLLLAVDKAAGSITVPAITSAMTASNVIKIYKANNNAPTTSNDRAFGLMGFNGIANTANATGTRHGTTKWQGINRATAANAWARGILIQGGAYGGTNGQATNITKAALQKLTQVAGARMDKVKKPSFLLTHEFGLNHIEERYSGDARIFTGPPNDLGYDPDNYTIMKVPVKLSNRMPPGQIHAPVMENIFFLYHLPLGWATRRDGNKFVSSATYLLESAAVRFYGDMVSDAPWLQAQLRDMNVSDWAW